MYYKENLSEFFTGIGHFVKRFHSIIIKIYNLHLEVCLKKVMISRIVHAFETLNLNFLTHSVTSSAPCA